MPITRTRKIALSGLAVVGVLVGAAGLANAVTSATHDSDESVNYSSSVEVPASVEANAKSDDAEDAALAKLAKIDIGQAASAATKAVPGKAIEAELEEESGNLVYEVDVVTDKGTVEVIVDAGNAKVLDHQAESDDDHGDAEKDETPETTPKRAPAPGASTTNPAGPSTTTGR